MDQENVQVLLEGFVKVWDGFFCFFKCLCISYWYVSVQDLFIFSFYDLQIGKEDSGILWNQEFKLLLKKEKNLLDNNLFFIYFVGGGVFKLCKCGWLVIRVIFFLVLI